MLSSPALPTTDRGIEEIFSTSAIFAVLPPKDTEIRLSDITSICRMKSMLLGQRFDEKCRRKNVTLNDV